MKAIRKGSFYFCKVPKGTYLEFLKIKWKGPWKCLFIGNHVIDWSGSTGKWCGIKYLYRKK